MCELCCATVMAGNCGRHTCRQQNVTYLLMLSKYNIIRTFNDPCLFSKRTWFYFFFFIFFFYLKLNVFHWFQWPIQTCSKWGVFSCYSPEMSVSVCLYLYANVEVQCPCWIRRTFLEECCHNLSSVPVADGTVNDQKETKSFYSQVLIIKRNTIT